MSKNRPAHFEQDSAMQVRSCLQARARRRIVKDVLARSAQGRRLVLRTLAAALAAVVAGHLAFAELLAG